MIDVVMADITTVDADAIVHPVSAEWDPVTPVMRRLELAAGPEMQEQSAKVGELPVGSAVITGAGNLPVDFLIHIIVRSVTEPVSEWVVQRGLQNGLRRCVEWGIERVAIPPIGTGAGNLDAEEAAGLMIPILFDHMNDAEFPKEVLLVAESEYERDAFQQMLRYNDLPYLEDGQS